jgi:hypothetical protein
MINRGCYRFDRHRHREKIEEETMKKLQCFTVSLFVVFMFLVSIPATTGAQPEGPPPVGGPLVREGDFAVRLLSALDLGTTDDEVEAETRLGEVGIIPRNGWIADYPVTPDILGELQRSVVDAASSRKIPLGRAEALKRINAVSDEFELSVSPYTGGQASSPEPPAGGYANPEEINNYYAYEDAPVYTYYTPPPDFYYLYVWVPYPFWCRGFWFPGFFVLHDFHRHFVVHNKVVFVSNHFNDVKSNRAFRVDPRMRFSGKTYAGIGAPRSQNFITTGVPRSDREVFNAPRARMTPGMVNPPWGTPGTKTAPPWGSPGTKTGPPWGTPGTVSPAPRGGEKVIPPSRGVSPQPRSEEMTRPQPHGERTVSPPPHGEERTGSQPHGDGTPSPPSHGIGGAGHGR